MNFKNFPILGGSIPPTFYPELRNESFASVSFMGFPAILSTLQPFQICIFNRKNSKLTFSDGSKLMGKCLWQICMHHWTVRAKVEFPRFPPDVRTGGSIPQFLILNSGMNLNFFSNPGGVYSTPFDPELRNESFALISFMGFPAILSTLQPFQICIFHRKNSKLTFSNGPQLMGKCLWQICMHHWTVHAKVEFPRFPPDVWRGPFHNC